MSTGKKVLIGVGIYFVISIITLAIVSQTDSFKNAGTSAGSGTAKVDSAEAKAKAQEEEAAKPANERFQIAVAQAQKNNKLNTGFDKVLALRYAEDTCDVDVKINAYWNEDRIIADGCKIGLALAKEVFARCPECKVMRLRFFVDMQDQFGNVSETAVFNYNIFADTFAKVNFDNFSDMVLVDYNSMWVLADNLYIAPGIMRGLKKYRK